MMSEYSKSMLRAAMLIGAVAVGVSTPSATAADPPSSSAQAAERTPATELGMAVTVAKSFEYYRDWIIQHNVDFDDAWRVEAVVNAFDAAAGVLILTVKLPPSLTPDGGPSEVIQVLKPVSDLMLCPADLQSGESVWYYFTLRRVGPPASAGFSAQRHAAVFWQAMAVRRTTGLDDVLP